MLAAHASERTRVTSRGCHDSAVRPCARVWLLGGKAAFGARCVVQSAGRGHAKAGVLHDGEVEVATRVPCCTTGKLLRVCRAARRGSCSCYACGVLHDGVVAVEVATRVACWRVRATHVCTRARQLHTTTMTPLSKCATMVLVSGPHRANVDHLCAPCAPCDGRKAAATP